MKVFVSSTAHDLPKHRLAVALALERLGLQLARMETFGAVPDEPTEASFDEVEGSELFVGIYAHRYGYIRPGSKPSITEAEFEHAYKLRRPPFCFFVDSEYPWPQELIEQNPGKEKLAAFKARLEQLVVRDVFTTPDVLATRVATSIGRYLISDPRRHVGRGAAEYARATLADIATATFVDVMRLFNVASGDRVREANRARYGEFVDMADQHLSEFRVQVTRLAAEPDAQLLKSSSEVENGLAWALTRLRRRPELDRPRRDFVQVIADVAEKTNALAELATPDYYASRRQEVLTMVGGTLQKGQISLSNRSSDEYVQVRHFTQQLVLDKMRQTAAIAIATVRDDMDRVLAIPYFTIDLILLRSLVAPVSS